MDYLKIAKEVLEIEKQGLEFVSNNLGEEFSKTIETILKSSGRVVITGMGKSGLVGKKIAATLASTGTRSFFMHPGEAYHGDLGMIHPSDIVIAISNSGESEEVIKLLSFFKDNKNTVIGMTGNTNSTLANYSDIHLNIKVEKEACFLELAPTTSTTVTMAFGDAIAVALMKARDFKEENFARFHPGGSLGRKLLVKVSDVMKKENLPTIGINSEFKDILSTISAGRKGIAIVVDNDEVLGVVTDGDIRRTLEKIGEKALSMKAEALMTKDPKSIGPDIKIVEVEKLMQDNKITSILVTQNNKLVGVIDRYDL